MSEEKNFEKTNIVLKDVDIPFSRVIEIVFKWVFAIMIALIAVGMTIGLFWVFFAALMSM
tara:strand:- start:63 stop:242 length:180 start_codon:yes stop_codon:yes gene_type:complete